MRKCFGSWRPQRALAWSTGDTVRSTAKRPQTSARVHMSTVYGAAKTFQHQYHERSTTFLFKWQYLAAAKVALLSARESSPNLVPVLLFGGTQDAASPKALDNIVWFKEHGGIVYHHNLTFGPDLQVGADASDAGACHV